MGDVPANVKDPVFAAYYLAGLAILILSPRIRWWSLRIVMTGVMFGFAGAMRTVGYSLVIVYLLATLPELGKKKMVAAGIGEGVRNNHYWFVDGAGPRYPYAVCGQ